MLLASSTVTQAAAGGAVRSGSHNSADKENVSPAGNSETNLDDTLKLEKARALARSVDRGRMKGLIVGTNPKGSKAKGSRVATRSSRTNGKLSFVLNLPTDIFCEMVNYLSPSDLLHLARVSKALRALLMSKQSRRVWRAAREIHGLPECPEGVSDPEYASLLFDRECQACGSCIQSANIMLRLQLCKTCFNLNVIRGEELATGIPQGQSALEVFNLLPCFGVNANDALDAKYRPRVDRLRFFKGDFVVLLNNLQTLERNSAEWKAFTEERSRVVRRMLNGLDKIKIWLSDAKKNKSLQNSLLKAVREVSIVAILFLDYEASDISRAMEDHASEWKKLVEKPVALAPSSWIRIRSMLASLIQKSKEEEEHRKQVIIRSKTVFRCYYFYLTRRLPGWTFYFNPKTDKFMKDAVPLSAPALKWWNFVQDNSSIMAFSSTTSFITFKEFLRIPAVTAFVEEDDLGSEIMHAKLYQLVLDIKQTLIAIQSSMCDRFIAASIASHNSLIRDDMSTKTLSPPLKEAVRRALNLGQSILNGLAALYSAKELSFACLDYETFLSDLTHTVANASPDDRRFQGSDSLNLQCHRSTIIIAYSLLFSLGFQKPEEATISVLNAMGRSSCA